LKEASVNLVDVTAEKQDILMVKWVCSLQHCEAAICCEKFNKAKTSSNLGEAAAWHDQLMMCSLTHGTLPDPLENLALLLKVTSIYSLFRCA